MVFKDHGRALSCLIVDQKIDLIRLKRIPLGKDGNDSLNRSLRLRPEYLEIAGHIYQDGLEVIFHGFALEFIGQGL